MATMTGRRKSGRVTQHPPRQARWSLLVAVLVFALIKPDSLVYLGFGWLDTLLIATDVLLAIGLLIAALRGVYRPSSVTLTVALLFLALAVSTTLSGGSTTVLIQMAGPGLAACLLTDWGIQNRMRAFLSGATIGLLALFGANLLTILLYYPEGMYRTAWVQGDTYLMGFDNAMVYSLIPLMMYALLRSRLLHGTALDLVAVSAIGVAIVSVFYVKSGAGMVQVSIFLAIVVVSLIWPLHAALRASLPVVWLIGAGLVVLFRSSSVVPTWLLDVLGKDSTLTSRTSLWDYALGVIERNPLIGVGLGRGVVSATGHVYPHAHSLELDTLYTGGLVATVALILVIITVSVKLSKGPSGPASSIVTAAVFALLVGEAANSMQFKALFWATLATSAYLPQLSSAFSKASIKPMDLGTAVWGRSRHDRSVIA